MVKKKQVQGVDKKQLLIIAFVGLGVFSCIIAAAYFGQKKAGSPTQGASTKRFTAKAGTTRKNARALTSKRAPTEESSSQSAGGTQEPLSSWREPKNSEK